MAQTHDRVTARDQTINIRISKSQRDLIDQAAELREVSRSEFMLDAAYREAENVLLDRVFFALEPEAFDAFQAMLEEPFEPSPALHALLHRKAPWG